MTNIQPPRQLTIILLLLLGNFLAQADAEPQQKPAMLQLQVVSNLIGYIEPCGCTVDVMLGGISRLVRLSKTLSTETEHTLKLVVGPTFYNPKSKTELAAQDALKAKVIGKSLKRAGFKHMVQPTSKVGSADRIKQLLNDGGLSLIQEPQLLSAGPFRVGIIPISSKDATKTWNNTLPSQLKPAHLVVVVSALTRLETRRLMRSSAHVDLAILIEKPGEVSTLSKAGRGFVVEAGDRGRHLAVLTYNQPQNSGALIYEAEMDPLPTNPIFAAPVAVKARVDVKHARRITYQLIPLNGSIKADKLSAHWVYQYTESLRHLYADKISNASPLSKPHSPYSGIQQCSACHQDAVDFWTNTKHATAWQTLVRLNKTYDAECVGCHVTGWQEVGGSQIGSTQGLRNIQCEVCHGPGRKHVESGGDPEFIKRTAEIELCVSCHNLHHSPRFSYPQYKARVLGTGHGLP